MHNVLKSYQNYSRGEHEIRYFRSNIHQHILTKTNFISFVVFCENLTKNGHLTWMFSSRSVSETNPIHLSTVITWSNITIYCLHHCSIGGRIWIRDWICKMPTIPHPNFEENLPRYNDTALHIATALIGNVLLKLMTSSWFIGPVAALCLLICLVPKIDHSMEADSQWKCDDNIARLTLQVPRDFLRSRRPFGMTSYLHNGISYTGKMTSLYWFSPQNL